MQAGHHDRVGEYEKAIILFDQALDTYNQNNDGKGRFEALLQLGQTYHSLGLFEHALEKSKAAEGIGRESKDNRQVARALNVIFGIYLGAGRHHEARQVLDQLLGLIEKLSDPELKAAALNNLGNFHNAEAGYERACEAYMQSAALSKKTGNTMLSAIALTNAMTVFTRIGEYQRARSLIEDVMENTAPLEESQNKAFLLINIGFSCQQLSTHIPHMQAALLNLSEKAFFEAITIAENIGSERALSYANGYLGGLYETEHKYSQALRLTHIALFRAQEIDARESLFRWQWQAGRIYKALNNIEEALSHYRSAIYTLQSIQQVKISCYSQYPSNIRESVTAVSIELIDILLKHASESNDRNQNKLCLAEAREIAELRKVYELRNYYRDDCVDAARSGVTKLDDVSKTTVVVYPIVLNDRIEILFSLPSGLKRFTVNVDRDTLTHEVLSFRKLLEKRTTREYLVHAQTIYDWLIRPMAADVRNAGIDTMVFVPDGPLRAVPMAGTFRWRSIFS